MPPIFEYVYVIMNYTVRAAKAELQHHLSTLSDATTDTESDAKGGQYKQFSRDSNTGLR